MCCVSIFVLFFYAFFADFGVDVIDGLHGLHFFFFKQKTAYGVRISDWSSDVCSSDITAPASFGAEFAWIWLPGNIPYKCERCRCFGSCSSKSNNHSCSCPYLPIWYGCNLLSCIAIVSASLVSMVAPRV